MNWYCFRTQKKREYIAATHALKKCSIETFCPRIIEVKKTRRGPVKFVSAMFRNYMFARIDLQEHLTDMLGVIGIVDVLKRGGSIPVVPDSFVNELSASLTNDTLIIDRCASFSTCDWVRIIDGPFAGELLQIVRADSEDERVSVLMNMLGEDIEVRVSRTDLIPADAQ